MDITVNKDGHNLGPYSLEDLQAEIASSNISLEDDAWIKDWGEDWGTVADVPGSGSGGTAGGEDGIHIEKDGDEVGPYPLAQIQGMLNQGMVSLEDAAWMEGWAEWGTLGDVEGLKKPRVRVSGGTSPLSELSPGGGEKSKNPRKKRGQAQNDSEGGKKRKRARKRKARKGSSSLVQQLVPLAALLFVLAIAGIGYWIFKRIKEGDTITDIVTNPTAKEDSPPVEDPWAFVEWRKNRQR